MVKLAVDGYFTIQSEEFYKEEWKKMLECRCIKLVDITCRCNAIQAGSSLKLLTQKGRKQINFTFIIHFHNYVLLCVGQLFQISIKIKIRLYGYNMTTREKVLFCKGQHKNVFFIIPAGLFYRFDFSALS